MIKRLLQRTLKGLGLYVWFKEESFAYDVYRRFKAGRPLNWRTREVRFYRSLFGDAGPGMLIFDVGANRGQRTAVFLKLGATVISVEPDETNQRVLARKFLRSPRVRPVKIVGKALSDTARRETFWTTSPGSGLNTLSRKWVQTLDDNPGKLGARVVYPTHQEVQTTTLSELIREYGAPIYIKVDVEGHEPEVLRGLAQQIPFVSFEANLPEFRPEAEECIERLSRLSLGSQFNFTADCYKGFILREWLTGPEMTKVLGSLGETSIEIYCKS